MMRKIKAKNKISKKSGEEKIKVTSFYFFINEAENQIESVGKEKYELMSYYNQLCH